MKQKNKININEWLKQKSEENEISRLTRKNLEKIVLDLLKKYSDMSSPIAIAIDGAWGIGKSHMYREVLAEKIYKTCGKYPIYTSVFGKKDENEIIQDLLVQFLKKENLNVKRIKSVSNATLKTFSKYLPIDIDANFIFNCFEKTDLADTIICIDDFERLSDKIRLADMLGLISELKENKSCHIILICNQEHIKDKEVFRQYKEKIIDFNLLYQPTPIEQFELLKNQIGYPIDIGVNLVKFSGEKYNITQALNNFHLTNLREIRKLIRCFNDYCVSLDTSLFTSKHSLILFSNIVFAFLVRTRMLYLSKESPNNPIYSTEKSSKYDAYSYSDYAWNNVTNDFFYRLEENVFNYFKTTSFGFRGNRPKSPLEHFESILITELNTFFSELSL